ncbi:MAG TPA: hypothetical protein V6C57_00950 [Coleofasciculaceae cyanobacterium]
MQEINHPSLLPPLGFWIGMICLSGLAGCSAVTTVKAVQENPHRNWWTATVQLQGIVGDRVPLIDAQVYQLRDATGTIWVLTQRQDVRSGAKVLVKGQVHFQDIDIPGEGQDFGEPYIQEQQVEPAKN